MKKIIIALFAALVLCLSGAVAQAEGEAAKTASPIDQFTGKYWVNSQEVGKEAYLYGIESAIEVEYYINQKLAAQAAKSGKKPGFSLSPFEKGWMEAFKDTTRKQIAADIDKWYADHPDQIDRPVLSVIWYELIKPRISASK